MTPTEFYANRLKQHPLHEDIRALRGILKKLNGESDSEVQARGYRIEFLLNRFDTALRRCNPIMVPQSLLEVARQGLQQARASINTFLSNRNAGHLDNANNQMDQLFVSLNALEKSSPGKLVGAAAEIIAEIRNDSTAQIGVIEKEVKSLGSTIEEGDRRAAEFQNEIDRKSKSFSAELQRFSERYEQEEELRTKAAKQTLQAFAEKLSAAEKQYGDELASFSEIVRADVDVRIEEITRKADEVIAQLERDKTASAKLLGIVGETGTVGGYKREANLSRWEARTWNGIALVGLVWVAYQAYYFLNRAAQFEDRLTWEGLVARGMLLAVSGVIAAFATRQAARAHRVEESFRRLELELASVGPFIADLNVDVRERLKSELVQKIYGNAGESAVAGSEKTPVTAAQMVVDVLKEVPAIIKAGR